jgi:hypothetical protein
MTLQTIGAERAAKMNARGASPRHRHRVVDGASRPVAHLGPLDVRRGPGCSVCSELAPAVFSVGQGGRLHCGAGALLRTSVTGLHQGPGGSRQRGGTLADSAN